MTHEQSDERHVENVAEALRTHLGWTADRARAVLERSLGSGLILRDGEALPRFDRDEVARLLAAR